MTAYCRTFTALWHFQNISLIYRSQQAQTIQAAVVLAILYQFILIYEA